MNFGGYLEKCLKAHDISLNSAANMSGLNRGDLYHIIDSKRKMKPETFKNLVDTIGFTSEEEKKLTDLFFSSYYGEKEFEKIKFIIESINSFSKTLKVKAPKIPEFKGGFALADKTEILSAIKYLCENNTGEIITNYPFENKKADALFYTFCKEGKIKSLKHIVSFVRDNAHTENLSIFFSALKFFYEKQFIYFKYGDGDTSNQMLYPYYAVTGNCAVLFNHKNGIFIDDEAVVEDISQRAEKLLSECTQLGADMPDIFELKDTYVAAVTNGADVYEICPIPCLMCYSDKEFFYSICKPELPDRDFLVNIANDHYTNINKLIKYNQYMTVEGLDFLYKERECLEMPSEYADRMSKETLKRLFEKLYKALEKGDAKILDTKKLKIPTNLQIEITANGAMVYGYIFRKGENTEKPFLVVVNDKSFMESFKNFFDYLERGDFVYSKETALTYVSSRIVSLEY